MSFGKRAAEKPRWLDEDELEDKLSGQSQGGGDKPAVSMVELVGGGVLVIAAFFGAFFFLDFGSSTQAVPEAPALRLSVQD
jgi:hypothetical protein